MWRPSSPTPSHLRRRARRSVRLSTASDSRSSCRQAREWRSRAGHRGRLLYDSGQGGHLRRSGPGGRPGCPPLAHAATPPRLARAGCGAVVDGYTGRHCRGGGGSGGPRPGPCVVHHAPTRVVRVPRQRRGGGPPGGLFGPSAGPPQSGPKLARHEPAALRNAVHVGDVQAYLVWRLTGRWATSHGSADTLGLFDLQRMDWSAELLDLAGVRVEQLPDLVPAGDEIGTLSRELARSLGLPGAVPVVSGIGDGQAAGLGLGATVPGVAYLNLGTSMVLGVQSEEYLWDPALRALAGIRAGKFTLETVLNAAAYVATWCREQFGERGVDGAVGEDMEAAAARLPIGAEGLLTLPYWNAAQTPYWDALARGAVVGWHGRHTSAHLYRSILKGIGFELRLHLERLEEVTGQPIEVARAVGGGGRSPLWCRIISDITQRPVLVCAEPEASADQDRALCDVGD